MRFCVVQINFDQNSGPEITGPFESKVDAMSFIRKAADEFSKERRKDGATTSIVFYKYGAADGQTAERWNIQELKEPNV